MSERSRGDDGATRTGSNGSGPRKRLPGLHVLERAKEQLGVMTGRPPESVSSLEPSEDGWRLTIEVVEIEKIPDTTNVMARYEVEVDDDGNLLGFDLLHRYTRGQAEVDQ